MNSIKESSEQLRDQWLNGKTAAIRSRAFRDMQRKKSAEKIRISEIHRTLLERMIDRAGIQVTLRLISQICEDRSAIAPAGDDIRWAVASDAIRYAAEEAA